MLPLAPAGSPLAVPSSFPLCASPERLIQVRAGGTRCCHFAAAAILTVFSVFSNTSRASSKLHFSSMHSLSRFPGITSSSLLELARLGLCRTELASLFSMKTAVGKETGAREEHAPLCDAAGLGYRGSVLPESKPFPCVHSPVAPRPGMFQECYPLLEVSLVPKCNPEDQIWRTKSQSSRLTDVTDS